MWRHRRKLVESQAAERNRLLKVLETANIKLANVATAVFGVSDRMMLRALIEGKATPQGMAELAKGLLRKKIPDLQLALKGKLEEDHRFLMALQLQRLETAEKDLAALEQRIEQQLEPYAVQLALLDTRNSCLFIGLAGIPQPRPDRDDVHYRVSEQAMVREVPEYARQYPIEHPEFGPSIEPRSAGALAREAAKVVAQREAKAEPQPAQPRRKVWRQTQLRSGERTQPTAQAVGRTRKQSSSEGAKEPSRSILGQGRELERIRTDPTSRSRDPRRNGRKLARSPHRIRVRRNQRTEQRSPYGF